MNDIELTEYMHFVGSGVQNTVSRIAHRVSISALNALCVGASVVF